MADSSLRRPSIFDVERRNEPAFDASDVYRLRGSTTQFGRGLDTFFDSQTAGLHASRALDAELAGQDPASAQAQARQYQQLAEASAPRVRSLRDVEGFGDAVDFGLGTLGQGLGSMAPAIASAIVGRRLLGPVGAYFGAAAPNYDMMYNSAALEQMDDPVLSKATAEQRQSLARTQAAGGAALEAIVPAAISKVLPRGTHMAPVVAREGAEEAVTEGAQTLLSHAVNKTVDTERELDPWDLADATVAGALTGGVASGSARGIQSGVQALSGRIEDNKALDNTPVQLDPPAETGNENFVDRIVQRMEEAAPATATPGEFLNTVFATTTAEQAAQDLLPDTEDPGVMSAADPAEALQQRDAGRQERAAAFAEELLNDPATPDAVKERVASFGGDFSDPEARAFVAQNLVAMRAGEKITNAVSNLIDLSKSFVNKTREAVDKGMSAATDRIVKKNLQDADPAEQAAFNKLVFDNLTDEARAMPEVRQRLPEIANAMLAFASRTGDLTKEDLGTLSRMREGMSLFRDPEQFASQLIEYAAVPRAEDSFLSRIQRVANAQQDVRKPNSFLFMSLTEEAKNALLPAQLNQLARVVDEFAVRDAEEGVGDKLLAGLTAAFGSKENALAVLDYYQQQNRAELRFAPNETLVGGELNEQGEPAPTYKFANAKAKRPFRKFVGRVSNDDGMRGRRREATLAAKELRGAAPDGANVENISMAQYVEETGGNPEAEVKRITDDIETRIAEHKGRKNEDRSSQIRALEGELALLRETYKEGGAGAALDLYEVGKVSDRGQADAVASDEDLVAFRGLLDKTSRDTKEDILSTRITFEREDGSTFNLSAESMWTSLGDKQGSGGGEQSVARTRRLFAEAVAAVLARPEVKGIVGAENGRMPPGLVIDRKRKLTADRRKKSETSIKALREYEALREGQQRGVPQRRAFISEQLKEMAADLQQDEGLTPEEAVSFLQSEAVSDWLDAWKNQLNDITKAYEKLRAKAKAAWGAYDPKESPYAELLLARKLQAQADYARGSMMDFRKAVDDAVSTVFDSTYDALDTSDATADQLAELRSEANALSTRETRGHELLESLQIAEREARSAESGTSVQDMTEANERADRNKPRLYEEDTGLGVGAEKRGPKADAPKQSAMGAKPGRPGKDWGDKAAVMAEILRLRGKDVKVAVEKLVKQLGGSGQYSYDPETGERLIEIAINAQNPLGTARHEALHDFFRFLDSNEQTRSIAKALRDAANAPHVTAKLRELLKDHKEALDQLRDPEERVAYVYQFWAEGLLRVGPSTTGLFHTIRKFLKDLFGIVSTSQRAEDVLRAFHDGKFADPSIMQEVIHDLNASNGALLRDKMELAAPAVTAALRAMFNAAPDRLRRLENPYITQLADKFFSDSGRSGFIQKKFQQEGVWSNKLANILQGTTALQRREAIDQLQSMNPKSELAKKLAAFNKEIYEYMREAGVMSWDSATRKYVPLREVGRYFTRSWDPDAISRNPDGFAALLVKEGKLSPPEARKLTDNLMRGHEPRPGPKESPVDLGFMPYAPHTAERTLGFITPGNAAEFAKFQHKDLADIMTSYVRSATHRAEYAREFGNNGENISALVAKSKITDPKELKEISNAVQAMEGSLDPGKWSPETKRMMSSVMTLQNLVLLPLSLVAQMIDPIVLAARTGDLRDAGRAYATALNRLKNTITKSGSKVKGEELAEILGIVSEDSTLQAMAMAYGTTQMSKRMENLNRVFFKYNGMQGWNNSMRIAATAAAERYLIANKDDKAALEEIGLTPKDVKVSKDGKLDVSSPEMQQAIFKFVDQAVLRPSPAQRPVWMSDPRFLLVSHLKQFTFAMHNVVLKRANRELQNDNPKPWGTLMLAMPVILAADMAKFALTGGVPNSWGFKDYLVHAVERSGLLGLGDFGTQATQGVKYGAAPGERLLGPTFENLMETLRWISGDPRTDFGDVVDRTVPGARFV